jgi:hypothetical protein
MGVCGFVGGGGEGHANPRNPFSRAVSGRSAGPWRERRRKACLAFPACLNYQIPRVFWPMKRFPSA